MKPIPIQVYVKAALEDNEFSPDLAALQAQKESVAVFVYGSEKEKFVDRELMSRSKLIGFGWTTSPVYVLFKDTEKHIPVLLRRPADPKSARLYGEVYSVPVSELYETDNWYQNGIFHQRHTRCVQYYHKGDKDKKNKMLFVSDCWVYEAMPKTIDINSPNLTPCVCMTAAKPYYTWRRIDDEPHKDAF